MIKVIELSGQSNAIGRNTISTELPAEYEGPLNVMVWDGTDFTKMDITSGTSWNFDANTDDFGLQPFFKQISDLMPVGEVYLFQAAKGGTGIDPSFNEWYPGDTVFNTWNTNIQALGLWFEERKLNWGITHKIWLQGEADANTTPTADAYAANFSVLKKTKDVIYQGLQGFYPKWIQCPLITSSAQVGADTVRTAQINAATTETNLVNIENTNLSFFDTVHYDVDSCKRIHNRAANIILEDWNIHQRLPEEL